MSKIELGKTYRTRDGRQARIYALDGAAGCIHGAVLNPYGWGAFVWTSDGAPSIGFDAQGSLIEVKPRIKRTVWLNLYPDGQRANAVSANRSRAAADSEAGTLERLACIKIEIDCEEGEGL